MKVDTEIRHVTKPGTNLFLELGFAPEDASRLQAASRKQVDQTRPLRLQVNGSTRDIERRAILRDLAVAEAQEGIYDAPLQVSELSR